MGENQPPACLPCVSQGGPEAIRHALLCSLLAMAGVAVPVKLRATKAAAVLYTIHSESQIAFSSPLLP